MQEKFDNPGDAASYVAEGLAKDYPDAVAEIIQVVRNHPRTVTCRVEEIFPVLERACRDFPLASVEYHPDNPYGFVAEIRCHGEQGPNTTFERHKRDRPRVLVLLTQVGGKEVLVGTYAVPKSDT